MAFASRDGQSLFVIGGYNPEGILSDVWEFHLERREWDRVNIAAGPSPPERAYFRGKHEGQSATYVLRASPLRVGCIRSMSISLTTPAGHTFSHNTLQPGHHGRISFSASCLFRNVLHDVGGNFLAMVESATGRRSTKPSAAQIGN